MSWTLAVVIMLALAIGFGYLPARTAARKGYNLWIFWLFGIFFLFPAAIVAGLLRDKTIEPTG